MTEGDTATEIYARARALYLAGDFDAALALTETAVAEEPAAVALWNIRGVLLREAKRLPEALAALVRALDIEPRHGGARLNRANVLIEMGRASEASPIAAALVSEEPGNASYRFALGRAHGALERLEDGIAEIRGALSSRPDMAPAWVELAQLTASQRGAGAALEVLNEALAIVPDSQLVLERKAAMLRAARRSADAEAFLRPLLERHPEAPWVHLYLGDVLAERGSSEADTHLRRAVELAPGTRAPRISLMQHLARTAGPEGGERLDEAVSVAEQLLRIGEPTPHLAAIMYDVYSRAADFAGQERLGSLSALGEGWAVADRASALLHLLNRVRSDQDRRELLRAHELWGAAKARDAAESPIHRAPRAPREKIRVGILCADLRRHPMGYFVEPLFQHRAADRFELHCYSFSPLPPDDLERQFREQATNFQLLRGASDREAAQRIAMDSLDVLVDGGGTTGHNRAQVLAWKPAPLQASWLAYPHSSGLPTVDAMICDRFNKPAAQGLLAEEAWVLPGAWLALGPSTFRVDGSEEAVQPRERGRAITFGTMSNPRKYTPDALKAWAQIVAEVPESRFIFALREAGSAVFQRNMRRAFASEGVGPERIIFRSTRGAHLPYYAGLDISLDTFPLTGGATTVESLWMGVPVVSLRGPALFERLSWSIAGHLGLGDLVAADIDAYRATAVALAADHERLAELRRGLRARIRNSALGDTARFAAEFYEMLETKVSVAQPSRTA